MERSNGIPMEIFRLYNYVLTCKIKSVSASLSKIRSKKKTLYDIFITPNSF